MDTEEFKLGKVSSFVSLLVWLENILNEGLLDGQEFREFFVQFCGVELVVAPRGNDHLSLLLKSEVLPCEVGVNVVAVHLQDLVVADHSRVCEVPNPGEISLGHLNGNGEEFVQDRHGVWNVNNLFVPGDLRDEVARVQ